MAGAVDPDLAAIVGADIKATGAEAAKRVESWVTSEDGLGAFFSRRAYTLYGLAKREQDQDPYVRSGGLKARSMRAGRVNLRTGANQFQVKWQADSRILNFMKGKKAIYREQFETVSKPELDALDQRVQTGLDRLP